MENARDDFSAEQHKTLKALKRQVDAMLAQERELAGEDEARRDKALQDARDLVRMGQQQLAQLDTSSDEVFANDREGLKRTFAQLQSIVEKHS